jgi:hypothetical protein
MDLRCACACVKFTEFSHLESPKDMDTFVAHAVCLPPRIALHPRLTITNQMHTYIHALLLLVKNMAAEDA